MGIHDMEPQWIVIQWNAENSFRAGIIRECEFITHHPTLFSLSGLNELFGTKTPLLVSDTKEFDSFDRKNIFIFFLKPLSRLMMMAMIIMANTFGTNAISVRSNSGEE